MAIDLGRWFRDRKRQVEGVAAQVNPFDNGKTYSSVVQNTPVQTSTQVNQRSAQPPSNRTSNLINPQKPTWLDNQAFTVSSRPIAQPNFQAPKPNGSLQQEIDKSYGRGLSSLKNRLRDVVDSNTQADRIRRVAQTGLDESYQDQQARLTRDAMSRKDGDNIGAQTSGAFFKEGASFVGKSPSSIAQIQARVASSNNPLVRYGVGAVVPGAQYGLLPGGNKRGEQILRASQGINTTIDNKLQQSGLGDRADHNKWARGAGSVGFQLPALLATGPLGLAGMGSQTAADEANKAEMAGRTNEQALGIGLLQGGASMASEKFGLDRFLPGNGTAATSIKPFLGNMAKRIGTEGAQEAQQQFTQNLISNKTYNPNQGLKEGVFESAVLGGLSGGATSGLLDAPDVFNNRTPLNEGGHIAGPLALDFSKAQAEGKVFEGVDGKPRFEVDDSGAKIKNSNGKTLGEVLDHPELYKQYPELQGVKVLQDAGRGEDAYISDGVLHLKSDSTKDTIVHEIQHLIQDKEGFASGGTSSDFRTKSIPAKLKNVDFKRFNTKNQIRNTLKDMGVEVPHNVKNGDWSIASLENPRVRELAKKHTPELLAQYDELNAQLSKYQTSTAQYERLAGEAEARAVEARMNMPMSERYKNPLTVYHGGGGVDAINKNGVKILSPEQKLKYPSSGGGYVGLSTTTDKGYAQQFSQNIAGKNDVAEIKISPDAKIYELSADKAIDDMSANELTELSKKYDVIKSENDNEYRILNEKAIQKSAKPRSTFYDSLDVPKQDLIIRNGEGKAMSVEKDPLESLKQEARNTKPQLYNVTNEKLDLYRGENEVNARQASPDRAVYHADTAEYAETYGKVSSKQAEGRVFTADSSQAYNRINQPLRTAIAKYLPTEKWKKLPAEDRTEIQTWVNHTLEGERLSRQFNKPMPEVVKQAFNDLGIDYIRIPGDQFRGTVGKIGHQTEIIEIPKPKSQPPKSTLTAEKTPTAALKQEALKYKSAEEFVKTQGEPAYHRSQSKFDKFDISKVSNDSTRQNGGWGLYFSDAEPSSQTYGNYLHEVRIPKDTLLESGSPVSESVVSKIVDAVKRDNRNPNELNEFSHNGWLFYKTLGRILGSDKKASLFLARNGVDGLKMNRGSNFNDYILFDDKSIKTKQQLTDLYNQAHAEANTKSSNMSDRLLESTDPADIEMRRSLSGKNRPKGAFEIEQNQQMTDEQRLQATGGDIGQTGVASDPVALARAKAKLAEAVKESRAETKKKESKALIQITPTGAKAVDTRNKNIAQGGLPKLEQSQHPQTKQSNPTQTKLANQGKAAQNGNQQSQTGQSPDTQSNHSYAKPIKNFDTKQYIIEQVNAQKVSTKPSIKNMINNFIDKSKHVFVDDAVAYERYIKDKDKRASIREGVDQVRGSSMMARQFAEDNGMNELGKMSTKDLNEFQQYLIAKRSAELEARGIKTGRNLDADQSLIKDVGNKYDTQENIIRDYSNKMLDYSVDNGLISAELRDKLITENPNYVPMNRVMDAVNENSGFKSKQLGSLSQQTVVQKIEGSERTVENPIESLLLNTERMMNESARNRVARQLASESDLTERVINDGDKVRDGYDTLSYLDNGKKVRVEVPALVAQEMRNLNSVMPDWLETSMRLAGAPTKLLRSGATSANPIFAVSNLVRDQIQTAITGKVIANVKGTPKAFVAAFSPSAKGRALRAELRRNGIVGSEYRQTYGSKSGQLMQELQTHNKLGMKAVSKLKHPIESIADVIGATEYFTRAQQFYGTDGDVIARAQAARNNSLNFSRAGVLVRQMNRVIPFLNAGVQGGRITVNTIKNRPVKAAASTATMLGVALAVKALAQAQDDELYERLRDEEKKNNLIIFKPDAHYDPDSNRVEGIVKVPMPQMLYPLLDGVNNVKGKPEDLLRVAGDIFTAVSGIDATNPISQLTPTVVKPAVEIGLNKDLYTGMDLVSDYEKNKNPEDIAAKYGTQPARKLAETTGLPAPYFDNIFKNFGGGLAKDLTLALGKNPDNKRSGKGITGMLEGGLDRRFGSAGITSQYDIQSKLAEGYKDQLRNNSTFKSLSTDDQSKVLDKVDYDTKSIAGIMAKTEQNRNSEIKKDLSDRQKDIVEKGFNPDRFMQSIESGNKGKKDKTDYYKSNDAEYNSFKKEYDDKIKNNEYTKAGKIEAENKLRKLEVGKPYSKDARDLYDINKSQLAKWLSTDEKGVDKQKLHDELIAYDQALYDAGLIKYKKFKGGVATGRNGKGGSRKGGGKSKIDIAQILSKSNLQVQHSQNLSKLLAGTTFKGTKTKPSTSKNKSKVAQKTIKVDMRA